MIHMVYAFGSGLSVIVCLIFWQVLLVQIEI